MGKPASLPTVLLISKAISPPFNDGTKCLVRDIARNLRRVSPVVMTPKHVLLPELAVGPGAETVVVAPVYGGGSNFAPSFRDNAQAALWLLTRSQEQMWHFVFAPNPRTSVVARLLQAVRRVPVVQTVASPPRTFNRPQALFFGDVVVAQSRWTKQRILAAFADQGHSGPELRVIYPPAPSLPRVSPEAIRKVRRELQISQSAPVFLYPGDLESGMAAEFMIELSQVVSRALPEACVVLACRPKSVQATERAQALRDRSNPEQVRLLGTVPDMPSLLATATAVLFPVNDLRGKVDIPIALLEAMVLGVPVMALNWGPLAEVEGIVSLSKLDAAAWAARAQDFAAQPKLRAQVAERQKLAVAKQFAAEQAAAQYEEVYLELLNRKIRAA